MATPLDLQEQEQLDDIKRFWRQYGNLVTWTLVLVLGAFAAWNGWNWYQRDQAVKAGAMFDELQRAAQAGDAARAARVFDDLRQRFPRTAYAQQAGLVAARVQTDQGQAEAARASLAWVADNAVEDEYKALARLRLAAALMDAKQFEPALQQLDAVKAPAFAALAADRRGDVLMALDRKAEALAAYQSAWKAMDAKLDYRRVIDAKLMSLGAAPESAASAAEAAR